MHDTTALIPVTGRVEMTRKVGAVVAAAAGAGSGGRAPEQRPRTFDRVGAVGGLLRLFGPLLGCAGLRRGGAAATSNAKAI